MDEKSIVIGLYIPPSERPPTYEVTIRRNGEKIARRFVITDPKMTFEQIVELAESESEEAEEDRKWRIKRLLNKRYGTPYPKSIIDYWLGGKNNGAA